MGSGLAPLGALGLCARLESNAGAGDAIGESTRRICLASLWIGINVMMMHYSLCLLKSVILSQ